MVKVLETITKSVAPGSRSEIAVVELRRVDVLDEARPRPVGHRVQGLRRELRPEAGAADAQAHDVADALPAGALPLTLAHRLREDAKPLAPALDRGQHIHAVDHGVLVAAQRHVHRRAVLGGVHMLAGEEPGDAPRKVALAREGEERFERLGGDGLLGEVDGEPGARERELRAALGIFAPELTRRGVAHRIAVGKKVFPGDGFREGFHR